MEDFNSMGAFGALKARAAVRNAAQVVAIELACACQGVEFHRPLQTTPVLEAAIAKVRERVPRLEQDRSLVGRADDPGRRPAAGPAGARLGLDSRRMDYKLELIAIPVSDPDRAKDFYVQAGFNADHDHTVNEDVRFVQLTPPGSACSIALGKGVTDAEPGSVRGMQVVVADIDEAHADLSGRGIAVSDGAGLPVGPVRVLRGPGRQPLVGAAGPPPAVTEAPRIRRLADLDPVERERLLQRSLPQVFDPALWASIRGLYDEVAADGDAALCRALERFDRVVVAPRRAAGRAPPSSRAPASRSRPRCARRSTR